MRSLKRRSHTVWILSRGTCTSIWFTAAMKRFSSSSSSLVFFFSFDPLSMSRLTVRRWNLGLRRPTSASSWSRTVPDDEARPAVSKVDDFELANITRGGASDGWVCQGGDTRRNGGGRRDQRGANRRCPDAAPRKELTPRTWFFSLCWRRGFYRPMSFSCSVSQRLQETLQYNTWVRALKRAKEGDLRIGQKNLHA